MVVDPLQVESNIWDATANASWEATDAIVMDVAWTTTWDVESDATWGETWDSASDATSEPA